MKIGVEQVLEGIKEGIFEENCAQACKKNKHKSQNTKTRNLLSKQNIKKKNNKILTIEMPSAV